LSDPGGDGPDGNDSVRTLIRQGRIEAALGEVQSGGASERQLTEELRTYQAELVLQNEQLRVAEQAAAQAMEHFRRLFVLHPEPVLLLDVDGRIIECNDAASSLFGIGSLGGTHMYFSQRLAPAVRGAFLRSLGDAARGGTQLLPHAGLITPKGETASSWDIRMYGVPSDGGLLPQCAVVLSDQSRLLLRQDELQQRIDEQTRAVAELHAQSLALATSHSRIASRLVGELQEPLGRAVRYARSAHDSAPVRTGNDQFLQSQLDGIIDAANAMLRLVADLGQVVQSESGQLQLRPRRCEFGFQVREACRSGAAIAARGVRLMYKDSDGPVHLQADVGLLDQVLRTLLRVAVAQADPGSVVEVEWGQAPADDQLPDRATMRVTRSGPRRTPADLARMFSLFVGPVAESESGFREHLALVSCRVMVEMHGGRVWALGTEHGLQFRVWLPLDR
jgi:signal transduction histidine kinase